MGGSAFCQSFILISDFGCSMEFLWFHCDLVTCNPFLLSSPTPNIKHDLWLHTFFFGVIFGTPDCVLSIPMIYNVVSWIAWSSLFSNVGHVPSWQIYKDSAISKSRNCRSLQRCGDTRQQSILVVLLFGVFVDFELWQQSIPVTL